jgi:hypothetical protein
MDPDDRAFFRIGKNREFKPKPVREAVLVFLAGKSKPQKPWKRD